MNFPHLQSSIERQLSMLSPHTAAILDRALSGQDITVDEATSLFDAEGSELMALLAAADHLRARTVGDVVTYVINRNINFTNVCVKACGFCAFSRGHLAEQGYFLPNEEIIRRAREAYELLLPHESERAVARDTDVSSRSSDSSRWGKCMARL